VGWQPAIRDQPQPAAPDRQHTADRKCRIGLKAVGASTPSRPGTFRTGRRTRKRRWAMRSRLINARFAGKCRVCGKAVAKGEEVYFAKHYGVRCLGCGRTQQMTSRFHRSAAKNGVDRTAANAGADGSRAGYHRSEEPRRPALRRRHPPLRVLLRDRCRRGCLCDYAQNDTNRERIRQTQGSALSGHDRWAITSHAIGSWVSCITQHRSAGGRRSDAPSS